MELGDNERKIAIVVVLCIFTWMVVSVVCETIQVIYK